MSRLALFAAVQQDPKRDEFWHLRGAVRQWSLYPFGHDHLVLALSGHCGRLVIPSTPTDETRLAVRLGDVALIHRLWSTWVSGFSDALYRQSVPVTVPLRVLPDSARLGSADRAGGLPFAAGDPQHTSLSLHAGLIRPRQHRLAQVDRSSDPIFGSPRGSTVCLVQPGRLVSTVTRWRRIHFGRPGVACVPAAPDELDGQSAYRARQADRDWRGQPQPQQYHGVAHQQCQDQHCWQPWAACPASARLLRQQCPATFHQHFPLFSLLCPHWVRRNSLHSDRRVDPGGCGPPGSDDQTGSESAAAATATPPYRRLASDLIDHGPARPGPVRTVRITRRHSRCSAGCSHGPQRACARTTPPIFELIAQRHEQHPNERRRLGGNLHFLRAQSCSRHSPPGDAGIQPR